MSFAYRRLLSKSSALTKKQMSEFEQELVVVVSRMLFGEVNKCEDIAME